MKKHIFGILALVLCLSLYGCGKKEQAPEPVIPDTLPPLTEAPTWPSQEADESVSLTEAPTLPAVTAVPVEETEGAVSVEEAPEAEDPEEAIHATEASEEAPSGKPAVSGVTARIRGVYQVNVRKAPSVKSELVAQLKEGTEVTVYGSIEHDNAMWAQTNEGWIALQYLHLDGPMPERDPSLGIFGKVYQTETVNIRKEPTVQSEKVTTMNRNDLILIYETKMVAGVKWGRTENGWVSMKYVLMPPGSRVPESAD